MRLLLGAWVLLLMHTTESGQSVSVTNDLSLLGRAPRMKTITLVSGIQYEQSKQLIERELAFVYSPATMAKLGLKYIVIGQEESLRGGFYLSERGVSEISFFLEEDIHRPLLFLNLHPTFAEMLLVVLHHEIFHALEALLIGFQDEWQRKFHKHHPDVVRSYGRTNPKDDRAAIWEELMQPYVSGYSRQWNDDDDVILKADLIKTRLVAFDPHFRTLFAWKYFDCLYIAEIGDLPKEVHSNNCELLYAIYV